MEKNNNGKLALAIVAMFLVALTIIGVTYAFFTTSVQRNTTEDVKVQAGILSIAYAHGNVIEASNIVPGWKNDGKMIYHSQASVTTEEDGTVKIESVSVDSLTDAQKTAVTNGEATQTQPVQPLTFTVNNDGDDTAYYGIRFIGVDNTIVDSENFLITVAPNTGTSVTGLLTEKPLVATGYQNLSGAIEIPKDATHSFTVTAHYKNIDGVQDSQGRHAIAKIEIVGLNKVGSDYVAADGDTWTGLAA